MTKQEFKEIYTQFAKALKYLTDNDARLRKDPAKWEIVKNNFHAKFEAPIDAAWEQLSEEDKKYFASLYLPRKAAMDETVKKVLETFNGKIIKTEI